MSDITYAFAIGPGILSQQARWLLQSIEANTDATEDDIVSYLVLSEKEKISDETIEYFKQHSTLIEGEMPNPDYPLSAAHAALEMATKESKHEYTMLLDTDTVVLDNITLHQDSDAELLLVPEPISTNYWADTDQSLDSWRALYEQYDIAFPGLQVESTIHDQAMPPYFNSGVIISQNNTKFSEEYLRFSKKIHSTLSHHNYYSDMVSLGLISNKYHIETLPEAYNYLQKAHVSSPPNNVKILHYIKPMNLYRSLRNPTISSRLQETTIQHYFESIPKRKLYSGLIRSYVKAYELENPDSHLSNIISNLIDIQFKTRDIASKYR
jgi:hypothetical protein